MLQTENFTLFSNLDEAGVRAIGGNLEQLRGALVQELGDAAVEVPVPTLIYIFRDGESFSPFALPSGGAGFFMPHIHANFAAVVASDAAEATPVVYRQYVGELIRSEVPQSPPWHRYGLAELLSTFTVEGTVARIGVPPERSATLLADAPMGLDELLSTRQLPQGAESAAAFSSRAWGLVHYLLVADPERRRKTRAWAGRLAEDEALRDAFLETYGTDAATLEGELAAYLENDPLPELRIELEKTAGTDGRFVRLSPPDTLVALADLLLHTQPAKQAAAREILDIGLELAPESSPVTAARGYLEEQAGNLARARDLYAKALESFEEDEIARYRDGFRIYFYYAEAELGLLAEKRPQTDAERQRLGRTVEALERCVELREDYGEAWARLGYARSLGEETTAEAVSALERAYDLLPAREDVANNLLLAYARTGNRERASRLVDNLAHRGESQETLTRAREILFQIDYNSAAGLIRQGQIEAAAELLERIRAESTTPALRQRAGELLARIGK